MTPKILIVDDEPGVRELLRTQLHYLGHEVITAATPDAALEVIASQPSLQLVLLDIDLPGLSGLDLLDRIKVHDSQLQVIMVSGYGDVELVRRSLRSGAYDYLTKPFDLEDLASTVDRALERHQLIRQNQQYQQHLERMVLEQTEEIRQTRDIALLTLARLAESRDHETGHHLERIAAYSRTLGEALAGVSSRSRITPHFLASLERSAPLHDIGKVGIPDAILLKPGPLTPAEWAVMRSHTTIGGETLRGVIERFSGRTFLTMAMEIAYGHHERWNGKGYPRGLAGEDIPLAARIVALADAYDAITSSRPYKPAYSHDEAVRRIVADRGEHFDPQVVDAFLSCEGELAHIQLRLQDPEEVRAFAESRASRLI
jgi:putative two-component system response regulator